MTNFEMADIDKFIHNLNYDELKNLSKNVLLRQIIVLKTMQVKDKDKFNIELEKFYKMLFEFKKYLDDIETSINK